MLPTRPASLLLCSSTCWRCMHASMQWVGAIGRAERGGTGGRRETDQEPTKSTTGCRLLVSPRVPRPWTPASPIQVWPACPSPGQQASSHVTGGNGHTSRSERTSPYRALHAYVPRAGGWSCGFQGHSFATRGIMAGHDDPRKAAYESSSGAGAPCCGDTDTAGRQCSARSKSPHHPLDRVQGHPAPLQVTSGSRHSAGIRDSETSSSRALVHHTLPPRASPQVTPESRHDRTCLGVDLDDSTSSHWGSGSSSLLAWAPVSLAQALPGLAARASGFLAIGASKRALSTPCQPTAHRVNRHHRPRGSDTEARHARGSASIPPLHPAGLRKEPGPGYAR